MLEAVQSSLVHSVIVMSVVARPQALPLPLSPVAALYSSGLPHGSSALAPVRLMSDAGKKPFFTA